MSLQPSILGVGVEKSAQITYRGETFSGYNQPKRNSGPGRHKKVVLAKKGDKVRLIRYGHRGYGHNINPSRKKNYLARSGGIRNKSGQLTKNDKFSANYWARRDLWPSNKPTKAESSKTAAVAVKRDPQKWEAAKRQAKAKMGGKHSARAMQLATKIYKSSGGTYAGKKPSSSTNKLKRWGKQNWQWSGGSKDKGVYLPKRSASALKSTDKGRAKLRAAGRVKSIATSRGQQFSSHNLHKGKDR